MELISQPYVFLPLFIALWLTISWGLGRQGWSELAEVYPAREGFSGARYFLQSARLGAVGYGSCLVVGADSEGIRFSVLFPFRFGHPPFFVPWNDLSASARKRLWMTAVQLRFARCPTITLEISRGLAAKLARAGNRPPLVEG